MKASVLIACLTELQTKHGDMPVRSHGYEDDCEITEVEYHGTDWPDGPYFWLD